jgi:GNAT superfamily N-acetyltransferase
LQRHARKSHELGGSKTFVAADGAAILGFYSLSPASVEFARAPAVVKRGLARYDVPAFRMARLAVDLRFQGRGLGGQLLLAAGRRCLLAAAEVGGVALLIDAKNDRAAEWYASYGAVRLDDAPLILMLSLATVAQALRKGEL